MDINWLNDFNDISFNNIGIPAISQEILNGLSIRLDNPMLAPGLTFLVTSQCNIECRYCYNYLNKNHKHMDPTIASAFLDNYLAYQAKHDIKVPLRQIIFSGGEPTLNPEAIFGIMDYINLNRINCLPVILTNGVIKESVLEKLIEEKFHFQISYDSKESPLRVSREGKKIHNQLNATIEKIVAAGLPVFLRATFAAENLHNMLDIIRYAADKGIEKVIFSAIHLIGNAQKYQITRGSAADYINYYTKAAKLAKQLGVGFDSHEQLRINQQGKFQELPKLALLPDGHISLTTRYLTLQANYQRNTIIGHFDINKGIHFNSNKIKRIVNNFSYNIKKHCSNCECYKLCRGRNQNISTFMLSDVDAEIDHYICDVTRGIFEVLT